MQSDTRVRLSGVSYRYEDASSPALASVTAAVEPGEFVAVLGHNGSGKSTLAKLLNALYLPTEGTVVVCGYDTKEEKHLWDIRQRCGMIFQNPDNQIVATVVREDVAFGPTNLGLSVEEVGHRCVSALDLVGLADQESASPFDLSGGQQRLCAIAGVLAMRPRLLILDEPMAGLDPRGRQAIRSILGKIHSLGVTVVQVTHSMEDAALQQQVIVLDQGSVVAQGTPHEVFNTRTGQTLHERGLGLPQPLSWAQELAASGLDLGQDPLNLNDLARAIAHQLDPAASSSPRDSGKE